MTLSGLITIGAHSCSLSIFTQEDRVTAPSYQYKFKLRLLEGISSSGLISDQKLTQYIACFEDMKAHLIAHQVALENTHIFATAPLRQIQNPKVLTQAAYNIIAREIQILSESQECDYIYLGAQITLPCEEPRLVLDIGGGSTEVILGHQLKILHRCSLPLGSLNSQSLFIPETVSHEYMTQLQQEVERLFAPFRSDFIAEKKAHLCGISGIFQSLAEIQKARQYARIDRNLCRTLTEEILGQSAKTPDVFGLPSKRQASFVGGLIILTTLLDVLHITHIELSHGALREGLLHKLQQHLKTAPPTY